VPRSERVLKSLFIYLLLGAGVGVGVYAGRALGRSEPVLAWVGARLAASNLPVRILLSYVRPPPARASPLMPGMLVGVGAGVVLAVGVTWAGRGAGPLPVLFAVLGGVYTALYVFWFCWLGRSRSEVLVPGRRLPSFVLEDEAGRPVSSESFLGAPTLLLFYRGNWCPLCIAQVREVAERYRELERRGVRVVLVSPQPHENTRALAQRFQLPLLFLVDPGARVARQLGILHSSGTPLGFEALGYEADTVFPTGVLLGADGILLFAHQTDNYRVRPELDTFLHVLDAHSPFTASPALGCPTSPRRS